MADNELLLLRATVRKLRGERKVMHEMLTEVGVPNDVLGDGVATCLIGRLAIAIGTPKVDNTSECHCSEVPKVGTAYDFGHPAGSPDYCAKHGAIPGNVSIASHIQSEHGMTWVEYRAFESGQKHLSGCPRYK